jgi:hypothetical protein
MKMLLLSACLMLAGLQAVAAEPSAQDYVARHLPTPEHRVLWLTPPLKQRVEALLGHAYPGLRVRYWQQGARTAWVLDEIGKEQPITTGIVVEQGRILDIAVLAYRESRGGEVRQSFFTRQFTGASLTTRDALTQRVDGISGATLSVRAMQNMARLALLLDAQRGQPQP